MSQPAPSLSPHYLRSRLGKVCVSIMASTPAELIEKTTAAMRDSPFVEFRLDALPKPLAAIPRLKEFLYERSDCTAIATCRREANGGRFKGTIAAEMEILQKAAAAGCHLIDVELQTAEALKHGELGKLREKGTGIVISWHDFMATRDLDKIFERMEPLEADVIKVVSTARNLSDNLQMMHFLERVGDRRNVVGICMGEQGLISRVLGLRAGSMFTFAAPTQGEETAPGQIAARSLIDTYRAENLDAATKVFGVAGNPVKHSLSPLMMNTAFRRETVNGVYLALQTSKLSDLLSLIQEVPIQGLSVTMPFKQEVLPHLAKTDPLSERVGACNTLVRSQEGKLYGFNTDVAAVVRPLEKRMQLRDARILVLGAGGAARAAVFGLKDKGAEVFILNRTPQSGQKLAREAKAKTCRRDQLAKTTFDVIINATPSGMAGVKPVSILEPKEMNARLVFDLVYNPVETRLLRMAREKNIPVITGVEMFVHQGARQFEIWTGKPAPEEEMLRVVVHALRQRAEAAAEPAVKEKATREKAAPEKPTRNGRRSN